MLGARGAFDRRLEQGADRPIAVAVSGGADSLLALIETAAWAKAHGRRVVALSVDHGLQAMSASWTLQAGAAAQRLDCDFRPLPWTGDKPARGVPTAARLARHRLLADAARHIGARVIVTGHTGDDALENSALGQGVLFEWSASPVWPEGRGLALLRPLLDARREQIRSHLAAQGWTWVDDPANADPAHPRIAARRRIAGGGKTLAAPDLAAAAALARRAEVTGEMIRLPRAAVRDAETAARRRVVAAACVSLGGGEIRPRADRVTGLVDQLLGAGDFSVTLAGAQITARSEDILFVRNAGEQARGGLAPSILPCVWDGRYELGGSGEVKALRGQARLLPPDQVQALSSLPAQVRPSLPVIVRNSQVSCPVLANDRNSDFAALVSGRFLTACGVYAHETELK